MIGRQLIALTTHNLRLRRNTVVSWSIALALLVAMYVALYPSIKQIDIASVLEQYPKELMRAFGMEDAATAMSSTIGFLNTELFGFMLPLAIVFLPVGVIVRMTTRAEESGHLATLLAAPIARWVLVLAAMLTATLAIAVPLIVMVVVGLAAAPIAGVSLSLTEIGGSTLSLLPMGAFSGSIALVVIGATSRQGVATAVSIGLIVTMYLMNVLAGMVEIFEQIEWLSIFHYYTDWINHGISWNAFLAILALSAVLSLLGGWLFERRDLG